MTSYSLQRNVPKLPTIDQFCDRLVDALLGSRSLLVMLPEFIDPEILWQRLLERLHRRDCKYSVGRLPKLEGLAPVSALAQALGVSWNPSTTPHTVLNLQRHLAGDTELLYLHGIQNLSLQDSQQWLNLMRRWAQVSQNMVDLGESTVPICLIVSVHGRIQSVLEPMLFLEIHWWWGFPSLLETLLHCRLMQKVTSLDADMMWRENIVSELAGSDLDLVSFLWDDIRLPSHQLWDRLRQYARMKGWNREHTLALLSECDDLFRQRQDLVQTAPPRRVRALWAGGLVYATPEYGVELHSAALALLGDEDELRHRYWRGLAALVMPLVDQTRVVVCRYLTRLYGPDWPVQWCVPRNRAEETAVRNNPMACEWGYLHHLLTTRSELREAQDLIILVHSAQTIRNKVAHYRIISYDEFESFFRSTSILSSSRFGVE